MTDGAEPASAEIVTTRDRGVGRTEGEQHLHDALTGALRAGHLNGWRVYEQPHLNGDRPDFVLMHPERGVVIVEVKDWDLRHAEHERPEKSPIAQLRRYHTNILESYARTYVALHEAYGDPAFAVVETVVYFHHATHQEACHFLRRTTRKEHARALQYTAVLDRGRVDALARGDLAGTGIRTLGPRTSKFAREGILAALVKELDGWMRPIDYGLGREQPIPLDAAQKRQAAPTPGVHRRLKGAAGAGKSVVLASRAASLLETGQRVLVLTYNITLQHFLRDLIRQQYTGPTNRPLIDDLVIHHFHGFLATVAGKLHVALETVPDEPPELRTEVLEVTWPRQVLHHLDEVGPDFDPDLQFDAILIDEGQDFSNLWVSLALSFLTTRDEFLIAFDTRQNVYERDLVWLDSGGDVQGLGFSGPPAQLKHSHRLPDVMASVSNAFAERYLSPGEAATGTESIESIQGGLFDSVHHLMRWENQHDATPGTLMRQALRLIEFARNELGAHANDLVILADNEKTAVPLIHELKDAGYAVTHVFDDRVAHGEDDSPDRYKRQLKWRFQPADGRIKVCTVHSFKGWEAPYVIGLLGPPSGGHANSHRDFAQRASMIYIALTRLKRSNDGSSSLFAFVNADPRFDDMAAIVDDANGGQTSRRVVTRSRDSGP